MINLSNTIQSGVTIILLILVGFICCKLKLMDPKDFGNLNTYVAKLAFFFLTFRTLCGNNVRDLEWKPFGVSVLMVLTVYILCALMMVYPFKDRFGLYISTVFPSIYINYVISGMPIFLSIWDESDIGVVTVILLSNDLVTSPIFLFLSSIRQIIITNKNLQKQGKPKQKCSGKFLLVILLHMSQNMLLIGLLVGLIYSSFPLPSCTFLDELNKLLGDSCLALALFNVGAFLSQQSLMACSWIQFVFCIIVRLIISPAIAGCYCYFLNLTPKMSRQCIILTAQPTAVACFILAQVAQVGTGIGSAMILWSTVLMVPAVIFWLSVLDALHLFEEK